MGRLLLAFLLLTSAARALGPLRATPESPVLVVRPGATARLRLKLDLPAGWHTFPATPQVGPEGEGPAPLALRFPEGCGLTPVGPPGSGPLHRAWDEGFHREMATLEPGAWVEVDLRAGEDLAPGRRSLTLTLDHQVCRNGGCRPPESLEVPLLLEVQAPTLMAGLGAYLGFAFLAGLGALLTPCVFPLVPLTASYFLQRARSQGRSPLREALGFGAGLVASFAGLGLALSLLMGASGLQAVAADPRVNLALGLLFGLFALNLLGAYDLVLPRTWLNRVGTAPPAAGWAGLLLMGLAFALTSFTCTMPFVGTALVAAARGPWLRPFLGMLAFATAFALPFVLIALFPAVLHRLPRSGGWMGRLKVLLGFLELAAALKFLANADQVLGGGRLPRELVLSAWSACALLSALHLLALIPQAESQAPDPPGGLRLAGATGLLALALWFAPFAPRRLGALEAFLPPPLPNGSASLVVPPPAEGPWLEDLDAAFARARLEGRPVFVDFTGVTCTNCRWMEQAMFPRPAVARALEGHIRVRLWTDRRQPSDEAHRRLQEARFGTVELPLYVRFSPEGQVLGTQAFTQDEATFLAFLGEGR